MKIMSKYKKITVLLIAIFLLSGFSSAFMEKVPPPQDLPKRTNDKKAGIVIPAFDSSPYDILEKSYDPLNGVMYDEREGVFINLSTSNLDLSPHKLTFFHNKFGFITNDAYRIHISFKKSNKPQKMSTFSFSPFEITEPKSADDVKLVADAWVTFFDSLGWLRVKHSKNYGALPEEGNRPYMMWESEGFRLTLSIEINNWPYVKNGPKYGIIITFDPSPLPFS